MKSLTEELAETSAALRAQMPPEALAVLMAAQEQLVDGGLGEQGLRAGAKAPDFALPDADGQTVRLSDLLAAGPVVLSFYRGGWCPYCNLEIRALQAAQPEFATRGAKLVAISPQVPDRSRETVETHELTFPVLSDLGSKVGREYGLVFQLPEPARPLYRQFGFDLAEYNGDDEWEMPIPATYVIDQNGVIRHAFVDPDYSRRLDPVDIVAALDAIVVGA